MAFFADILTTFIFNYVFPKMFYFPLSILTRLIILLELTLLIGQPIMWKLIEHSVTQMVQVAQEHNFLLNYSKTSHFDINIHR